MLSANHGEGEGNAARFSKKRNGLWYWCVAMLADVPYDEARAAFDDPESAEENGSYAPAMRIALTKLGRQSAPRLKRFRTYDELKQNVILKVNPYNKGKDWHWVAWDAKRNKILDPWKPRPYIRRYLPVAVLTVE